MGVVNVPPYCIKDAEGNWSGMSIELWRHLSDKENLAFEWKEFDDTDELVTAMNAGEVNVGLPADLSAELTDTVLFLQQHYLTTLGVARPSHNRLWQIARGVFNMQLLWIILSLSALLAVVGTIIYYVERRKNEDHFGGERSTMEGIGSGFWWAGVTMTTIGYGDKAPTTLGGRVVAMLWMLVAMAVSASLTASVVSAVNSKQSLNFPDDLNGVKVGVPEYSPAEEYLKKRDYAFDTYDGLKEALRALKNGNVDMVVDDVTAMRYVVSENSDFSTSVTGTNSAPVAYAVMIQQGSDLPELLDEHLVKFILSPTWRNIVKDYGGGER